MDKSLPRPTGAIELIDAVDAYLLEYFGALETVYHEDVSELMHVDVHMALPTANRPYYTLMTSGMAEKPMLTPKGFEEWRYAELVMHVGPEWTPWNGSRDDINWWPIAILSGTAKYPHEQETWLAPGHSLPYAYSADHPCSHYAGAVFFPAPAECAAILCNR